MGEFQTRSTASASKSSANVSRSQAPAWERTALEALPPSRHAGLGQCNKCNLGRFVGSEAEPRGHGVICLSPAKRGLVERASDPTSLNRESIVESCTMRASTGQAWRATQMM